jgi:hypothetical protein
MQDEIYKKESTFFGRPSDPEPWIELFSHVMDGRRRRTGSESHPLHAQTASVEHFIAEHDQALIL